MHFRSKVGIITLVQFVSMSLLNIVNGANSVVTTCHRNNGDCVSNMLVSIIFFLLISVWFGAIWILGAGVQESRSKRLAQALIGVEGMVMLVALFNAKHHTDILSLITSLLDLLLAAWVISLCVLVWRANGGRLVVSRSRQRQRRRGPISKL